MILPASPCRRYRPVLVDLVDRAERGPATVAALDHLAGCPPCERELTELALTVAALRRAGVAYRALPVPASAPLVPAVRTGRRNPWAWRLQLASLATSAGLAVMLVAPHAGPLHEPARSDAGMPSHPPAAGAWLGAEHRLAFRTEAARAAAPVSVPPRYPEGLTRPWKEVPEPDASPREREPR